MKRKKRVKKGIESLREVIKEHEEKLNRAIAEGREELAGYYAHEIKDKEGQMEKKKKILEK